MKKPVVVIGLGEMGEYFAGGFLKMGYPVVPVLRGDSLAALIETGMDPELVLVAVGEKDFDHVLKTMPKAWCERLVFLQNELLPVDWISHGIQQPTMVVVWFDKKKGRPIVNVLPNQVAGPLAPLVRAALVKQGTPTFEVPLDRLDYEMVRKNLYILTINIAGIRVGGTVNTLWAQHRDLVLAVSDEILKIQWARLGKTLSKADLIKGMCEGFEGDPNHICMGRSAPERLERARQKAAEFGIATPTLDAIAGSLSRHD